MTLEAIQAAIPHRPPFLLIDEIVEQTADRIVCRKRFTGDEFWYQGHYPDYPLTPGVLLCEAAMQAGAVLLSKIIAQASEERTAEGVPVATRMNNVQFRAMVHPGEEIMLEVELIERLASAFFMKAKVVNASTGKLAARLEFACTMAEVPEA
ncbi:MAG: beta-hydroxyacyl-ACP dehydratase [Planctomycetes bacterium]|nr:beta-hydroxyacyl-ACP dehydratase [Planctomycetota bacterium]